MAEEREELENDEIVVETEETSAESGTEEKVETRSEDDQGSSEDDRASGDEELDSYSKGVQNRIKKLTEKYRKEERDREEAVRLAQQLLQEKQQLEGRLKQLDSGYLNEYGARIEAQVAAAKRSYKEAYDSGDADKVIEAQEMLSRALSDQQRYDLAKRRAEERVAVEQQQVAQPQQYQQPQQQPRQEVQPDPKAQSWAEKNEWFGQDEVMTYAAFGVHRKLVEEEGFDPQSDEYYSEIDRRMRSEFPHKFKTEKKSGGGSQVASAGNSASRSTKQGRRTVKLSPSQIAIAKKLNVPLEEYAKYVKE